MRTVDGYSKAVSAVSVRPGLLDNYKPHLIGLVIPVLLFASLAVMMHAMIKEADKIAFAASALYIVGMLVGVAFALYGVVILGVPSPRLLHLPVPQVPRQGAVAGGGRLLHAAS